MEVFLRAIFDSRYALVSYLFRRALDHLASQYPTRLADYYQTGLGKIGTRDLLQIADHLEVIKVAMEVNALWIVPVAYYRVCSEGVAQILDKGVGGAIAVSEWSLQESPKDCTTPEVCRPKHLGLSKHLLRRVGIGFTRPLNS
ncbi:hypothetical protein C8R44DRAFT_164445 [Mycena epipterygia]|nr:hypothetical protein C8R44DRAFT_164445 [Mycena epipterygia]